MEKAYITYQDFNMAIHHRLEDGVNGTTYQPIGKTDDGKILHMVWGWDTGYDKDDTLYQLQVGDTLYTLCAKLAFNIDDLQCDYDVDWYMPYTKDGDIWDTHQAIDKIDYSIEWYNQQAQAILKAMNRGEITV